MIETQFDYSRLTELPFGISGRVLRSPMPYGKYDPRRAVLKEALDEGVTVVVDLVPDDEALEKTGLVLRELYSEKGLRVIYSPIADFNIPEPQALQQALDAARHELEQGFTIMVHCNAGFGRTGVFVGCMARDFLGLDGPAAVNWVRQYIPTALENELQVDFVCKWR